MTQADLEQTSAWKDIGKTALTVLMWPRGVDTHPEPRDQLVIAPGEVAHVLLGWGAIQNREHRLFTRSLLAEAWVVGAVGIAHRCWWRHQKRYEAIDWFTFICRGIETPDVMPALMSLDHLGAPMTVRLNLVQEHFPR